MIHEWPEGRSNPAGNQEASHLRSSVCTKGSSVAATGAAPAAAATWRSARTGLSMHIGNKLAVIESVRSLHATKGRLPSTIRPSVLLNFFFVFYSSFFVFFFFISLFSSLVHHPRSPPVYALCYSLRWFGLSGSFDGAQHAALAEICRAL